MATCSEKQGSEKDELIPFRESGGEARAGAALIARDDPQQGHKVRGGKIPVHGSALRDPRPGPLASEKGTPS